MAGQRLSRLLVTCCVLGVTALPAAPVAASGPWFWTHQVITEYPTPAVPFMAGAEPAVSKDQALKRLEELFRLPPGQPEVSQDVSGGHNVWRFHWTRQLPVANGFFVGAGSATVDADTGAVLEFGHFPWLQRWTVSPQISPDRAQQKAWDLVQELVPPERIDQLEPWEYEDDPLSVGPVTTFRWVRKIDGIPFPQDDVTVSIDLATGEVTAFHIFWTEHVAARKPEQPATPEQALDIYRKQVGLELYYHPVSRSSRFHMARPSTWVPAYRLRGQVTDVDAATGSPLNWSGTPVSPDEFVPAQLPVAAGQPSISSPLTAVAAQEMARKLLLVPAGIPAHTMPIDSPFISGTQFMFYDQSRDYGSMWIDLNTGLIRDAYRSTHPPEGPAEPGNPDISSAEPATVERSTAVANATQLVQTWYSALAGQLGGVTFPYGTAESSETIRLFFPRLVDGVPVAQDGIHVTMGLDGNWQSVSLEWSEAAPVAETPAVQLDEAVEKMFTAWQPRLIWKTDSEVGYYSGSDSSADHPVELRLVYRLVPRNGKSGLTQVISGRTGGFLNYDGQEISAWQALRDKLLQHPSGAELLLLMDTGMLDASEGALDPDRDLTRAEALQLIFGGPFAGMGISSTATLPFTDVQPGEPLFEVAAAALEKGALEPSGDRLNGQAAITRGEFAWYMAAALGLNRLAHSDLNVILPYADLDSIPEHQQRAVAFLAGLGLLDGEGSFRPQDSITVAEGAKLASQFAAMAWN